MTSYRRSNPAAPVTWATAQELRAPGHRPYRRASSVRGTVAGMATRPSSGPWQMPHTTTAQRYIDRYTHNETDAAKLRQIINEAAETANTSGVLQLVGYHERYGWTRCDADNQATAPKLHNKRIVTANGIQPPDRPFANA